VNAGREGAGVRTGTIVAISAAVTGLGFIALERGSRVTAHAEVTARPPFRAPGGIERRRALGDLTSLSTAQRAPFDEVGFDPIPSPKPGDWLAAQPEAGQTYPEFVASRPNRPDAARGTLYIQPLGGFPPDDAPPLDLLARFAEAFFQIPVRIGPPRDLSSLGVTARSRPGAASPQLLTGDLLRYLARELPADGFCLLGVTMEDLYPGGEWNFVFGQASLRERVGIHSFARYRPSAHSPDEATGAVVLLRSAKVLAHETGHMFGMQHCVHFLCVMNGSNHLDELDSRPLHLCPVCLRKLQWSVGFDAVTRDERLLSVVDEAGLTAERR